jgi:hypothetical protein
MMQILQAQNFVFLDKTRISLRLNYENMNTYSEHPKAGPSGFQMVISRTLFVSGIQMAFETWSEVFSASLDRFVMNKIFFYDPY